MPVVGNKQQDDEGLVTMTENLAYQRADVVRGSQRSTDRRDDASTNSPSEVEYAVIGNEVVKQADVGLVQMTVNSAYKQSDATKKSQRSVNLQNRVVEVEYDCPATGNKLVGKQVSSHASAEVVHK